MTFVLIMAGTLLVAFAVAAYILFLIRVAFASRIRARDGS